MYLRPIVALIAAPLLALSLAACGSDKPASKPTKGSDSTASPTEAAPAAYFDGLPRFKFSEPLNCSQLAQSLDLTPLAKRMFPEASGVRAGVLFSKHRL